MKAYRINFPDVRFISRVDDETIERTARQELAILVGLPDDPRQAVSVRWMRDRMRLVDGLEASDNHEFLASSDEYQVLRGVIDRDLWGGFNRSALALAEAIENAEEVEVGEQPSLEDAEL